MFKRLFSFIALLFLLPFQADAEPLVGDYERPSAVPTFANETHNDQITFLHGSYICVAASIALTIIYSRTYPMRILKNKHVAWYTSITLLNNKTGKTASCMRL
jgi:hypothetical protein